VRDGEIRPVTKECCEVVVDPREQRRPSVQSEAPVDVALGCWAAGGRAGGDSLKCSLFVVHQHDLATVFTGLAHDGPETLELLDPGRKLRHHDIVASAEGGYQPCCWLLAGLRFKVAMKLSRQPPTRLTTFGVEVEHSGMPIGV
jgi:hypothetical protein